MYPCPEAVHVFKGVVLEEFLQVLPYLFARVELRAVGRYPEQIDVIGYFYVLGRVEACVIYQENFEFLRFLNEAIPINR